MSAPGPGRYAIYILTERRGTIYIFEPNVPHVFLEHSPKYTVAETSSFFFSEPKTYRKESAIQCGTYDYSACSGTIKGEHGAGSSVRDGAIRKFCSASYVLNGEGVPASVASLRGSQCQGAHYLYSNGSDRMGVGSSTHKCSRSLINGQPDPHMLAFLGI